LLDVLPGDAGGVLAARIARSDLKKQSSGFAIPADSSGSGGFEIASSHPAKKKPAMGCGLEERDDKRSQGLT
jgi:hypothetical protein